MLRAELYEREIRRAIGLPEEGERAVLGVATLDAGEDRCLYFATGQLPAETKEAFARLSGCILISPTGSGLNGQLGDCVVLETSDPRAAMARVLAFIRDEQRHPPLVTERIVSSTAVISPLAVIEGNVEIEEDVAIEPFCLIGPDVIIGRGSIIRSGARIFPHVRIGSESVVGVNSVVGHQGYGFVRDASGNKSRMPHLGGVEIGSRVEIGALTSVQAGTIGPTVIEDHAKIDEHVHVGHNVRVARSASVTCGTVIGGHAVIETEAWVGINSSIREGRRVGAYALVGMDASVQQDIPDDSVARAPRPQVEARPRGDRFGIGFRKK